MTVFNLEVWHESISVRYDIAGGYGCTMGQSYRSVCKQSLVR